MELRHLHSTRAARVLPPAECLRIRVYHVVIWADPPNEAPFHIREQIATEGRAEAAALAAVALENERRASVERPPIVDFEIEEAVLHQIYRSTVSWRALAAVTDQEAA